MGKVKIGINGFGRIGRLVLRAVCAREGVEVVGINDPFIDLDYAKYLLEYDSIHGRFDGEVKVDGEYLIVNDMKIKFFAEKDPTIIDWKGVAIALREIGFEGCFSLETHPSLSLPDLLFEDECMQYRKIAQSIIRWKKL